MYKYTQIRVYRLACIYAPVPECSIDGLSYTAWLVMRVQQLENKHQRMYLKRLGVHISSVKIGAAGCVESHNVLPAPPIYTQPAVRTRRGDAPAAAAPGRYAQEDARHVGGGADCLPSSANGAGATRKEERHPQRQPRRRLTTQRNAMAAPWLLHGGTRPTI